MFFRIFFVAWTGLHLYVFWRAASIPLISGHVSRKFLLIIGAVLWLSFLLRRFADNLGAESIARPIEIFVMNWLGILFLISVSLFAADIVTGFGFIFRHHVPTIRSVALVTGIVLAAIAFVQALRPPVVSDYEIRLAHLPAEADGLTVIAISDLHLGTHIREPWLAARVDQLNKLQPDVVVIVGDLFEGDSRNEYRNSMMTILRGLAAPLGVWAVTGNHEYHGGLDLSLRFLDGAGISVLRDRWTELRPGLLLAGIDDRRHSADTSSQIRKALADRPTNAATILLSHRPQRAEEAAAEGVGLMLCGHTHGGQIWPFTYISGLANPLLAGKYVIDGLPVIVSRGMGTWGPRMRLWSPGEIVRITLRAP